MPAAINIIPTTFMCFVLTGYTNQELMACHKKVAVLKNFTEYE
jgi:hypothetical protein